MHEIKTPAHPEDGEGFSGRNVGNLHILMRLSVPENIIEFCSRESFETDIGDVL